MDRERLDRGFGFDTWIDISFGCCGWEGSSSLMEGSWLLSSPLDMIGSRQVQFTAGGIILRICFLFLFFSTFFSSSFFLGGAKPRN